MSEDRKMKFWKLVSVCKDLNVTLNADCVDKKWSRYVNWYKRYSDIVNTQDRAILDSEVPNELCRELFKLSSVTVYISNGYLRKTPLGNADEIISIIDVYDKYGGDVIEEVFEAGLVETR